MSKETTAKVARLAARFLSGELKTLSRPQQLSLAASALAQAEAEQESVKAWGLKDNKTGQLDQWAYRTEGHAKIVGGPDAIPTPVLITRVRPARADKRLTKRKQGK